MSTAEFLGIYRRHRAPLYGYVAGRLGDWALAEDLASDTWIKALRAFHTVRPGPVDPERRHAKIHAWLRVIARRVIADHLRMRSRRPCEVLTDIIPEIPVPISAPDDLGPALAGLPPEAAALRPGLRAELLELLRRCPDERDPEVVAMRRRVRRASHAGDPGDPQDNGIPLFVLVRSLPVEQVWRIHREAVSRGVTS